MDIVPERTLDRAYIRLCSMGLVFLHVDLDGLHIYRGHVQGFSASAFAGLSLVRNIAGAGFPLFADQLFLNEGFEWAGSILGFLALLLVPIPFILARYGRILRMRSPWARQHMDDRAVEEGFVQPGDVEK